MYPASAADAAVGGKELKGIKTLLANGSITFFINGNPVSNNGPSNLLKNPPDWIILFSYFIIIKSISYLCFLSCCE